MRDILCMYYSRTGATRQAMTEIAQALDAELVELTDGVDRSGARGYLRSGMDAMRRATLPLAPYETERPLSDYRLVILGPRVGGPLRLPCPGASEAPGPGAGAGGLCADPEKLPEIRGRLPPDGPIYRPAPSAGGIPASGLRGL